MNPLVNGISQTTFPKTIQTKPEISPGEAQSKFADTLKSAIEGVNNTQITSDKMTQALANGQAEDLHNVMITAQKASVTLETSVQIQRKVIDAYNEIMRMQI
ncbi:flagellar hook-basal body complex protein FliE [Virgibacillus kekensis]|uniref:Flagellar hook-basal body complex protein FliE n=1 Tax=Virgibacillus kekensis TaxID=202261 RepID=A0ABV9DFD9_9BACI